MKVYIERAKAVHPLINAAVDERFDEALKNAKEVDKFLDSKRKSEEDIAKDTPLLGIPFSCKETIGVTGMKQTSGLVRSKDHIAKVDGGAPAMYRKAGAIPFLVTDIPELCMWWESSNHVNGLTKNPYDNTRTVGGSSGGEGAVVTSASSIIGIGNDIAGSIRIPACFSGIYGHKPSRDIVPNWGVFPFCDMKPEKEDRTKDFVSTGPMCRYVQDLPLLLNVLSGNDKRLHLDKKVNFKNVKVYYLEELPGLLHAAVPDVKKSIKTAVKHFEETYGIKAIPLQCPELKYAFYIWESKLLEYDGPPFKFYIKGEAKSINLWLELFKSIFRCSEHTLPALYFGLVDRREKDDFYNLCLEKYKAIERKFEEIFNEDAIVLVPTHPEPAPHYLMTIPMYPNIAYTCIFNVLGYPSTQIPAGLSKGVPIGIQAVSGPFKDHISIATAFELDTVFNGWISPSPIRNS
ncbi:fatty-acid amide hydrolase 2 [Trichonephila clavata]|uniref:Fatty-acid amide hydrolase 2 n=1 Tax=Trichonephila clavata TaxID=2740835 RepID=A0A8X6LWQ4_TRICU|nr:fatty-acid amide hydrolase 2 [Trichonephila clavata]